MGMPITIDIPGAKNLEVFKQAFSRLNQIDESYSPYKPNSDVSKYSATDKSVSPELKNIIKACKEAEEMTNGYFSAWASGKFDPSGYVKGWAIAQAGKIIEQHGYKTYCISAGGDILARSGGEKAWNIGIQDPAYPKKILNKLSITNGAVCTSGNYERGQHIINPKTRRPADELLSVTIIGPDIIKADVLATAVFAMGNSGEEFMKQQADYKALIAKSHSQGSSQ